MNTFPRSLNENLKEFIYSFYTKRFGGNKKAVDKLFEAYQMVGALPNIPGKLTGCFGEKIALEIFHAMPNSEVQQLNETKMDFNVYDKNIEVKTLGNGVVINQLHSNDENIYYLVFNLKKELFYFAPSTELWGISRRQHDATVRMSDWRDIENNFPKHVYKASQANFKKMQKLLQA